MDERGQATSLAERYLLLGLRLGRHVEGLVDAYYGPPELAQQVRDEPVAEPDELAAEAESLLGSLPDGWLRDQVRGVRTYAGVLAGEGLSYADEVEGCYGVRPKRADPQVYAVVHARLEELLPGSGSLAERYQRFRTEHAVAAELIVPALRDVIPELRERTQELLELPEAESVELDAVRDEPWWAFNYYLGGLRSRVVVNVDTLTTCDDVVELAAHEVYPGHHTEHAAKEQRLLRDRGLLEESLQLVPTPQALVSEGIAETGPDLVLTEGVRARVGDVLRAHGLRYDSEREAAVRRARESLRTVAVDAALMVHEEGASTDEAQAYIERWSALSQERAAQSVRFVTDPTWRAYAVTYSAGRDLCRAYVGGDPVRFRRLLTEHVRVGELRAAADDRPAVSSPP